MSKASPSPLRAITNLYEALADDDSSNDSGDSISKHVSTIPEAKEYPPQDTMSPDSVDIASGKLRRQAERIAQNDNLIEDMVKKGRAQRSNKWRPLDIHELTQETHVDLESARNTPLDGSARIFQPMPLPHLPGSNALKDYSRIDRLLSRSDSIQEDYSGRTSTEPSKTSLLAAPNRQAIESVFGEKLPSPGFCQSHPGTKNGQIQFCSHPNGDVSAQQWFAGQYQWINVGQYSNVRKKTEGQLASDRLKGETGLQALQKNTLAYFRIIAKQREASVMNIPIDMADVQACLGTVADSENSAPSEVSGGSAARPPVAVPLQFALHQTASETHPTSTHVLSGYPRNPLSIRSDTTHASTSLLAYQDVVSRMSRPLARSLHSVPSIYPPSEPAATINGRTLVDFREAKSLYGDRSYTQNVPLADVHVSAVGSFHSIDTATSVENTGRTVMYDPFQDSKKDTPISTLTAGDLLQDGNTGAISGVNLPLAASLQRHRETIQRLGYKTALTLRDPPTPQILDKSGLESFHERKGPAYDSELEKWFTSGAKAARHEDFYEHLKTLPRLASIKRVPGIIARPTNLISTGTKDALDQGITRLLIPVCENLASYVEGSSAQRHGHWARFVPPPEWAIDKSVTGNNSFLDEEWSKPSTTSARDQRYSALGALTFGEARRSAAQIGFGSAAVEGLWASGTRGRTM